MHHLLGDTLVLRGNALRLEHRCRHIRVPVHGLLQRVTLPPKHIISMRPVPSAVPIRPHKRLAAISRPVLLVERRRVPHRLQQNLTRSRPTSTDVPQSRWPNLAQLPHPGVLEHGLPAARVRRREDCREEVPSFVEKSLPKPLKLTRTFLTKPVNDSNAIVVDSWDLDFGDESRKPSFNGPSKPFQTHPDPPTRPAAPATSRPPTTSLSSAAPSSSPPSSRPSKPASGSGPSLTQLARPC